MDVDDFKICNDTYGHYAGDMALETAANTIRSCIRTSTCSSATAETNFCWCYPAFRETSCNQAGTDQSRRAEALYPVIRIFVSH